MQPDLGFVERDDVALDGDVAQLPEETSVEPSPAVQVRLRDREVVRKPRVQDDGKTRIGGVELVLVDIRDARPDDDQSWLDDFFVPPDTDGRLVLGVGKLAQNVRQVRRVVPRGRS
jgi:hypothetical protein